MKGPVRFVRPAAPGQQRVSRGFDATKVWIFDLDNTLYPSSCNLFAQVDRRMGEFIARYLGVPFEQARHLQKTYYRQFGTTLSGLMRVHKLEPQAFLDYVHDIDVSVVPPAPQLAAALERLPGRRLIFTNGSRAHATRVAERLGILHLFHGLSGIECCGYAPKPEAEAFDRMIRKHAVAPAEAAMFEDMPHNLEVPDALGMTTVLVRSDYMDHPAQARIRDWTQPPPHIHHVTDDLTDFVAKLSVAQPPQAR